MQLFLNSFFDSMKKMQKEMKDVELQLGIVANQVRIRSITQWSLLLMARDITAQVSQLVKTRHEKMTSADDSRHSIDNDLCKLA